MESTGLELSAKITKSICMHFESKGVVVGDYLEIADISSHKALDSEMWIPAEQVEHFIDLIFKDFPDFSPKEVALSAPELRGWGLLDQVLRILQSPCEIYENPKQFLSYFVRPNLNFAWIEKEEKLSSFSVALSTDETPLVVDYLIGALEVVSKYIGADSTHVSWIGNAVSVDWSKKQDSLFAEKKEPVNYKPEIYKEAVEIIHRQQNEINTLKANTSSSVGASVGVDAALVMEDLKVLSDYFLRSRQLISLLKAESGKKKWFKEAVKRLNWDELQGLHTQKIADIKNKLTNQSPSVPMELQFEESGEQIDFGLDA